MDPATLYILFTLADGSQKALERPFVSVAACEAFVDTVIRPMEAKATIEQYECVSLVKMQSAPKWYTQYAPQRLIHGVPLDRKFTGE